MMGGGCCCCSSSSSSSSYSYSYSCVTGREEAQEARSRGDEERVKKRWVVPACWDSVLI
jgi:hypothetical protein